MWFLRMITSIAACILIPCNLRSAQLHHIVDVMDVVVLDDAEHTAHPADDTALLTVVDVVSDG